MNNASWFWEQKQKKLTNKMTKEYILAALS